jgi:uncharacterized protein YbjT (DUF2867 family)
MDSNERNIMISKSEIILVAGVTGQQGGAVARQLLRKGYDVRGLTRHPEHAGELRRLGAEIVMGDMTDKSRLEEVFRDVKRLFLVTTPWESSADAETQQGINMVDAARDAGVSHLVFNSVAGANKNTGIPYYDSKAQIERHIRKLNVPATILRPAFFMENFGAGWILDSLKEGEWSTPIRPDRPVQMIAVDDIARFVVTALENPGDYEAVDADLAGDNVTLSEAVHMISRASGRSIQYRQMSYAESEKAYGLGMATGYRRLDEVGTDVDVPWLEKQWGIRTIRFKDFLKNAAFVRELTPAARAA